MFAHKHYVPVLKCKSGDLWALRELSAGANELITPLIEPIPPSEKKTELVQLQGSVTSIRRAWTDKRFFADLLWRRNVPNLPDTRHVVTAFFDLARTANLNAVPVTAPDRNAAFQAAVAGVMAQDGRGVAIRLAPDHFQDAAMLTAILNALLAVLATTRDHVDLIIDFGHIRDTPAALMAQLIRAAVAITPNLRDWRTLTVISGSFPPDLTQFNQGMWNRRTRAEWVAWRGVVTGANPPARLPSYGDYAVGDPDLPYVQHANFAANLRYSVGTEFLVWRGHSVRHHARGFNQMFDICASLVVLTDYAGAGFSTGDAEIELRAATVGSPGNPTLWRQWATNHYLELVASQIASLP